MLTWLTRILAWSSTRLSSSAARDEALKARARADQLRDARNWEDAAGLYREFLLVFSGNADLWIQLGNMYKEAGRYDAAAKAYLRAMRLRAGSAEALFQLGNVRRRQGRFAEAAKLYSRAVRFDDRSPAAKALTAPDIGVHLRRDRRGEAVVRQALQRLAPDFDISATSGMAPGAEPGSFILTGDDPWIELVFRHNRQAPFGLLRMDFELLSKDRSDRGIYLDYGNGYEESRKIDLANIGKSNGEILIAVPSMIRAIRWDPDTRSNRMILHKIDYRPLTDMADVEAWLAANRKDGESIEVVMASIRALADDTAPSAEKVADMQSDLPFGGAGFDGRHGIRKYREWITTYASPSAADYARMAKMVTAFEVRPKFSFVIPVYNPPVDLLSACIDSMLAQSYTDFEICIADDCSPNPDIAKLLARYAAEDNRVKVRLRTRNGHISAASNSALDMATGDYVILIDHDDLIPEYCLFVVTYYININPECMILFSDEDKIDINGVRSSPYFKSEFNEFLMYGHNMVSHLGVYNRDLINDIGGFREGLEGSQDYDLFLRCYEKIRPDQVIHIPHVLYHWRAIPGSTAVSADQKDYAIVAAKAAINGYFERNAIAWRSIDGFAPGVTALKATRHYERSISIVIPTRDGIDILEPCISSIVATNPENVEIIIVDNDSTDPETLDYLDGLVARGVAKVLCHEKAFNFSNINNFAVGHASGDIVCFLNNDTEILSTRWLDRARALLARPDVGMVGARLVYPDGGVQHHGVVLGMGAHRVAGLPHAGLPSHMPGYFGKNRLIQEFSAVTAACMFVSRADFLSVGGFDPDLAVAYNDVDLCLKIGAKGLKIICDPEIELIHKESRSRGADMEGEKAERLAREAALMHDRWHDKLLHDPYYSPNLSLDRGDFALAYPPRAAWPWHMA